MRNLGFVLALAPLVLLLAGCPSSRTTARCSIIASPVSATAATPPQMTLMARNPTAEPAPLNVSPTLPVHCAGALPAYLRGSPVDDLTAVWTGAITSNGQPLRVCPSFPSKLTPEAPQIVDPPCGASACPNQQVSFGDGGTTVHVLFYDDPSQHDPSRATEAPSGACYYRVYAMSVAWDGKAPQ